MDPPRHGASWQPLACAQAVADDSGKVGVVPLDWQPLGENADTGEEPSRGPIAGNAPAFSNREDAGNHLAAALLRFRDKDTIILGIPRGGVLVAAAVARRLGAELDVVIARKLCVPDMPELAMGAVTAAGRLQINQETVARHGVTETQLAAAIARETAEARAREERFRGGRPATAHRAAHGHRCR